MAQLPEYNPASFSQKAWDANLRAALDTEFYNIKAVLDVARANLEVIQRDDTKLANDSVHVEALTDEAVNTLGEGVTDHGALDGLSDDDHTQYLLTDGSRVLTAKQSYDSHPTFSANTELVDKKYVDDEVAAGGLTLRDEDDMASDSATDAASQQSIKAYVDLTRQVTESAAFTVGASHIGAVVNCDSAGGFAVQLPSDATDNRPIGFTTMLRWVGDGAITIGDDSEASTILYASDSFTLEIAEKQGAALAIKVASNTWWVTGDLKPVPEVTVIFIPVLDASTNCSVGNGAGGARYFVPDTLNGQNVVGVKGYVATAGTTNSMLVQIENVTQGYGILSSRINFASGAKVDDGTAALNTDRDHLATNDELRIDIDQIHSTPAQGLWIELQTKTP